jgi:prepilin-type N-terminal cleavage/methylation domain-containing protein
MSVMVLINRKGFTLVELLAVIVILAVILVIAIPNVIKVIDKAKLDTYKRNEDMLISATQKYMASNGIALANVGDTTTINYSQLQDDKLIDKITDQTSNIECNKSNVKITKTTNGYTYTPVLLCDNYIDFNKFNLITNWNFSNGTTGWTNGGSSSSLSATNNTLTITGGNYNAPTAAFITSIPSVINDKIYARVKIKITNPSSTSTKTYTYNGTTTRTIYSTNSYVQNNQYTLSGIATQTTVGTQNLSILINHVYVDAATAIGKVMEVQDVIVLNLTNLYGSGNEPSDPAIIDNMINKSK